MVITDSKSLQKIISVARGFELLPLSMISSPLNFISKNKHKNNLHNRQDNRLEPLED